MSSMSMPFKLVSFIYYYSVFGILESFYQVFFDNILPAIRMKKWCDIYEIIYFQNHGANPVSDSS